MKGQGWAELAGIWSDNQPFMVFLSQAGGA
jgi:hypothetical protein